MTIFQIFPLVVFLSGVGLDDTTTYHAIHSLHYAEQNPYAPSCNLVGLGALSIAEVTTVLIGTHYLAPKHPTFAKVVRLAVGYSRWSHPKQVSWAGTPRHLLFLTW